MNRLDTDEINKKSPYDVYSEGEQFVFITDNGIEYHVDFELDSNPYYIAYWLNLANPRHMKSHSDKKSPRLLYALLKSSSIKILK